MEAGATSAASCQVHTPLTPAPAFGRPPSQRLSKGEHAVIARKIEGADRVRITDGAVMRIVEQQGEAAAAHPRAAERGDQCGIVPLVDDDEIGVREQRGGIIALREGLRAQLGIGRRIGVQSCLAMIGQQIGKAPRARRLQRQDIMTPRHELAQDAAQEVGVAVIPAGAQRMGEIADLHAAAARIGSSVA